jgi:mannan endo-1,4-beta-mannosidase
VATFDAAGAANVVWVFNPITVTGESTPMESFYPGDDVVDWVAFDGFNWGHAKFGGLWQSYADIFGDSFTRARLMAPGKPLMIAEFGSDSDWNGHSKAEWLTDSYAALQRDGVRAVVQFDRTKVEETDWRVWSSPGAGDAVRVAMGATGAHFLTASNTSLANLEASLVAPIK